MKLHKSLSLVIALGFANCGAFAQHLPPPSRTVFKCETEDKTFYSDSPCLGAKKVDVEPTRGLNKTSGTESAGKDVSREIQREQFAGAVSPITGLNAKQFEVASRRQKLSSDAQRRCQSLEEAIPQQERQEALAPSSARDQMRSDLLNLRTEYRRLKC
ncbi:MAG: hypothetical protein QE279_02090 [Rhodoferax sp.]|nr:hypothetical protein [Rhodoferax sp.]